jgi:hypothetical protein
MAGFGSNGSGDDRFARGKVELRRAGQEAEECDDCRLLAECGRFFQVMDQMEKGSSAEDSDQNWSERKPSLGERWVRVVWTISNVKATTVEGLQEKLRVAKEFLDHLGEDPSDLLVRSVFRDVESLMAGELRSSSRQ